MCLCLVLPNRCKSLLILSHLWWRCRFVKEFADNEFLSGSYATPQEALQAGIAEVRRDV